MDRDPVGRAFYLWRRGNRTIHLGSVTSQESDVVAQRDRIGICHLALGGSLKRAFRFVQALQIDIGIGECQIPDRRIWIYIEDFLRLIERLCIPARDWVDESG